MSTLRVVPPDSNLFDVLKRALELNLAPEANLSATVIASVIRRIAAIIAPCTRRELLTQASRALTGCLGDLPEGTLLEVVDDLIVGGDLAEEPALLEGHEDAPVLIFCRQPTFCRSLTRVYLLGAAPDDAPILPKSMMRDVLCDGGVRYLTIDSDPSICETLPRMGLHELSLDQWLPAPAAQSARQLIEHLKAMMGSRGREDHLVGVRWLTSSHGNCSYRQRWREETNDEGLLIARAPQPYGEDAWYLAERSNGTTRFLQFPLEEFPKDRGCDLGWRVQLALDYIADRPAWYETVTDLDSSKLTVSFPVPSRERLALIHLGGRREITTSPYEFILPAASLLLAESILRGIHFISPRSPA
jgi:hypothetical protein